jgi:hypothetical protein
VRATAQMLTYEVFMGLALMGVVMLAGSFNLSTIVLAQERMWFCIPQFAGLVIFLIAGLAEAHRLPFDLPEAESELVSGFHTEYSGIKFGLFFVGEYLGITLVSMITVTLYFGGWMGPFLPPVVWFCAQDVSSHLCFHPDAGCASAAALRPADAFCLVGDDAVVAVQFAGHRRHRHIHPLRRLCMLSILDAIATVLQHTFRKRETIQYPEQKPYLAPRFGAGSSCRATRTAKNAAWPATVLGRLPGRLYRLAGHRG